MSTALRVCMGYDKDGYKIYGARAMHHLTVYAEGHRVKCRNNTAYLGLSFRVVAPVNRICSDNLNLKLTQNYGDVYGQFITNCPNNKVLSWRSNLRASIFFEMFLIP